MTVWMNENKNGVNRNVTFDVVVILWFLFFFRVRGKGEQAGYYGAAD